MDGSFERHLAECKLRLSVASVLLEIQLGLESSQPLKRSSCMVYDHEHTYTIRHWHGH